MVVINPDGSSATLTQGFTVESGGAPRIWVDVLGRGSLLSGQDQRYTVIYGNRGNVDAGNVPLGFAVPSSTNPGLNLNLAAAPLPAAVTPLSLSQDPFQVQAAGNSVGGLVVPYVPAGQTGSFDIDLTAGATTPAAFPVQVWDNPFWVTSPTLATPPLDSDAQACLGQATVSGLATLLVTADPVAATTAAGAETSAAVVPGIGYYPKQLEQQGAIFSVGNYEYALVERMTGNTLTQVDAVKAATAAFDAGFVNPIAICAGTAQKLDSPTLPVQVTAARSQVELSGARGAGTAQYISGQEPLRYSILFENPAAATRAVQTLVITDQLDVANVDLSTFSFGTIVLSGNQNFFGPTSFGNRVFTPHPGLNDFTTSLALASNFFVFVNAHLDTGTGLVTWRFTAIDPNTGLALISRMGCWLWEPRAVCCSL